MNKAAIKKFAVESRQKLIKSTIERLEELGITDNDVVELVELGGVYSVKSQTLTEIEKKHRDVILSKIKEKGYESFVEEIAYTWFNRIIAIRYMEVNDYLPFRTRVLSSEIPGKVDPDLITEITDHIDELELNRDKIITLKETHQQEELFKYVFIKVCNYLGQFLPVMFEQIQDYTELLLPNVMITKGSVIKDMIELVREEDWNNQVEIIGWLYQYYISEKKDQVFADLKKNKKITKENIPAATQLFTPEWIVKYMVENSLGRLWLEGHPNKELQSKWKYYVEEAEQEESVQVELNKIKKESEILTPEDLTIIDPAMGSGHILVYAFDVLYQIYQSEGYSEKEIPRFILEKNIHGLDIDDRAGQLAYFALMMKARSYNRRFLREMKKNIIELNVYSLQESNEFLQSDIIYFSQNNTMLEEDISYLIDIFKAAKDVGSLLLLEKKSWDSVEFRFNEILEEEVDLLDSNGRLRFLELGCKLIKQAKLLNKKYKVAITNPPYMGSKSMSNQLGNYIKEHYSNSKSDLCTAFIERCLAYTDNNSYISMITMHSWMFLGSYEDLRKDLVDKNLITSLIHLGTKAFEEIGGEVVQTTTFVMSKRQIREYFSTFIRLVDFQGTKNKETQLFNNNNRYNIDVGIFKNIPGNTITYWLSEEAINCFKYDTIGEYADAKQGLITGDNDYFLRLWYEIEIVKFKKKWIPYNKGGEFRRWYGNNLFTVNWENDGYEIKNFKDSKGKLRSRPQNLQYFFKKNISWTKVTMGKFSTRFIPEGFIFSDAGSSLFVKNQDNFEHVLGFTNSKVAQLLLDAINPTMNYGVGQVCSLPLLLPENNEIKEIVRQCIDISKYDWDSYEISWDFSSHPLIRFKEFYINEGVIKWQTYVENQIEALKIREQLLNQIFINYYGLDNWLSPEVNKEDIAITNINLDEGIKSFISYAVGCMMGRYSLDEDGLIYAGGEFESSKYQTFEADNDGIILISDTEYFEDDLLNKFVEFVKVVYGEETLEENLNFIADTECFKRKATESSRDCLRRYFLKGFMEDHLKVYQKRPIYWMFDSGKQNGFKALIYMHRYDENMVAKVRTDYLHPLQRKYEAELERLDHLINFENISTIEKGKAKKRQEQIYKQIDECKEYDLLLAHVAHQRIHLDLDDGVKVNYQKFQNIELPSDGSSKGKKGDLLYKVKM